MMFCLTGMPNQIFFRLSTKLHLRFTCGPTSFRWSSEDLWILDAIVWWRLFGIYSARVAGWTLIALKMPSRCFRTCSFFRWLIFAATLCDPWLVIWIL
jgi:hypothetical protein